MNCPKCGCESISTERRPNGNHICLACGHVWPNQPAPSVNSSEVWLLWQCWDERHPQLYGVFLTEQIAFRRKCEQENKPGNTRVWRISRREIGVLGEE